MTAREFVHRLRERGVRLSAEGSRLRWRGPAATLTATVTSTLKECKEEILEVLLSEQFAEYGLLRCSLCRRILLAHHVDQDTTGQNVCSDSADCMTFRDSVRDRPQSGH